MHPVAGRPGGVPSVPKPQGVQSEAPADEKK
jgi:hypothetical protein